ncbi:MAG: amino acid ABC transporter permease [Anaerolineales bacterium]|nr:amino acid ABC transporter permease [Anaerolineales bacterium]
MTAITKSINQLRGSLERGFNWQLFLQDNITGSWLQMVWVAALALLTVYYTIQQMQSLPVTTIIVLVLWVVGVVLVAVGALRRKHTPISRWLKENLLSSVSNTLLTLFLSLVLVAAVNGILQWAVINATFDAARTAPEFQPENGATWGVIWGARKLLLTGLLAPGLSWRVWASLIFIIVMWAVSYISGRPNLKEPLRVVRLVTNILWLLSPVILYIFLAGVPDNPYNIGGVVTGAVVLLAIYGLLWWQKVISFTPVTLGATALAWPVLYTVWWAIGRTGIFAPINVDDWGGLLLTLIIASAVIVLSLPLGIVLALGRRSEVYGIPNWIVWPVALLATLWGFTTTPELLATSRNTFEQIISFWPILILGVAYMLQHQFKGNVVAGASTAFIELIRSVPLITLLFMGIVMAPFFFKTGTSIAKPWPVIVGYAFFSSAYMAETIRGGLQAIPKGQYEAADALGFNSLQKMRFIIMPQALRIVIPPIVGQFIGAFKSSSLVSIVGLFDLLGIQKAILANAQWQGLRLELYVFLGVVYFIGSFVMSSYSRRLESRLSTGDR